MSGKRIVKNTGIIFLSIFLISIIFSLFFLYFSIPSEIILPEHTQLSINSIPIGSFETDADDDSIPSINTNYNTIKIKSGAVGEYGYDYKLFNSIPIKQVSVTVIPKNYVIPSGKTYGVKMYTDGLLVVSVSSVTGKDFNVYYPAKDAGICEGDRILSVDGIKLNTNEELAKYVNEKKEKIRLEIAREDEIITTDITPVMSNDNDSYKIGIWVRDSTAGIGTMTYYNPEDGSFGALGHAITDTDTGDILTVSKGSLIDCSILSIKKGKSGTPGELTGGFSGGSVATIIENNDFGIYGFLINDKKIPDNEPVEIATRFQVKQGDAYILSDVDGEGVRKYSVEIVKISQSAALDNKGIIIKVTDPELLEKTGGIVQGLSGSPLVQNGKLIGAVTHVFVNDPTRGYGIFIENMLAEAEKIK